MEGNEAGIILKYDGDIVWNNRVTTRTLGKSLVHTQNAIDRAYLDLKYGNLWKHARMKKEFYDEADFIALYPEPGSFVQGLISVSHLGPVIVDRINRALAGAVETAMAEGEENNNSIQSQFESRLNQLNHEIVQPVPFAQAIDNPDPKVVRRYGDRCINREIDQMLAILRSGHSGESFLDLRLNGAKPVTYHFDKQLADNFHSLVAQRELGSPVIYVCSVRQLDKVDKKGKVINLENNKTIILHFMNDQGFLKAHPYLGNDDVMAFIGAPLIEYGAHDPNAGDVFFLDLV
jgi:hypothetical protein